MNKKYLLFLIIPIFILIIFSLDLFEDKTKNLDQENYVKMIDIASSQNILVPFNQVEEKYYSGEARLESWSQICSEYTFADSSLGCVIDTNPNETCPIPVDGWPPCLVDINLKPKTIPMCLEKYNNAYLPRSISNYVVSVSSYAMNYCDLYNSPELHGDICNDKWIKYKKISQKDLKKLDKKEFIIKYCLNDITPDWKSWGYLERNDKVTYGPISNFKNTLINYCVDESCKFTLDDGTVNLIQCRKYNLPEPQPIIIFNSTSGFYECR